MAKRAARLALEPQKPEPVRRLEMRLCKDGRKRPLVRIRTIEELVDDFLLRVWINPVTHCWEWTGEHNELGYALITYGGKHHRASRFIYEYATGKPLGRLHACHTCDTPKCVFPIHIFPGTQSDNSMDAVSKGRIRHGEAHRSARFRDEQIIAMRNQYKTGATLKALSVQYQAPATTIFHIVNYINWKHLP